MSISRIFSVLVAVVFVVTKILAIGAGTATGAAMSSGQVLSDCLQQHQSSVSRAEPAAADWVARHAASLKAGNAVDLSDYVQRPSGSASPTDRAATADWVARHAASLKVDNTVYLSDYVQRPSGSASPADRGATADWVARHAASLTAGSAVVSGC
jgi:hypothetical protein